MKTRLDSIANLATIAIAVVAIAVFVYKMVGRASPPTPPAVGTHVPVTGSAANRFLILVVSTKCRFCGQDADFYRELHGVRTSGGKMMAVFPESVADANGYLRRLNIQVDDVVQSETSRFGTSGTPTLLITDRNGAVTHAWLGVLGARRKEVLAAWSCATCPP